MSKVDDLLKEEFYPPAGMNVGKLEIVDELAFFDNLEIDESVIEAKRNGGGEIAEDETDCEGCKI